MNNKFTYIEVLKWEDNTVIKRTDVSGLSQKRIDKIEDGIIINLNRDEYYTKQTESDVKLGKI
jgi:hypothetical protein